MDYIIILRPSSTVANSSIPAKVHILEIRALRNNLRLFTYGYHYYTYAYL